MIIIGEKINGAIPSVAKAIAERNDQWIRDLAKAQADAGADYIDVCASVDDEVELETMEWLVNQVQAVTDVPIALDSPNPNILVEAMKFCDRPGMLNSVSMEGNKTDVVFPAMAGTAWSCVALLCAKGIPSSAEERLQVFADLMAKAESLGVTPAQMHVDPMVEMICTSPDGIGMIESVMRTIRQQYEDIHITGAISNISFNLPSRRTMNQAFAVLAVNAGMTSAILDPLDRDLRGAILAAEALAGLDPYCIEYVGGFRAGIFGTKKS